MKYNINGEGAMGKPGWWLFLIVPFFNMLVCACFGHVGWMLLWAIAFSSCAHEYGYESGKTEGRLSRQSGRAVLTDGFDRITNETKDT